MSQENVEGVRRGYEHFRETGDFQEETFAPGFVWDMSTFRGWPAQHTYMQMYASPEEALEATGLGA